MKVVHKVESGLNFPRTKYDLTVIGADATEDVTRVTCNKCLKAMARDAKKDGDK
jgi:hypothetical protein